MPYRDPYGQNSNEIEHGHLGHIAKFYQFGEGWQSTEGRMPMIEPLPFDEIDTPKSLLDRIEERQLMSYERLDSVGISAEKVRQVMVALHFLHPRLSEWERWQLAVSEVANIGWLKIAPIIYENLV